LTGRAQGDYYVQVIDNDLLNRPCPLGFNVRINRDAKAPLVTVAQLNANTSCDPAAVAEGEVQLTVTTAAGDLNPKNYYLANITPLPQGFVLNPSPGNLIGASGQSTPLIGGFLPQAYTFRVQDDVSKCFRDITVNIPNQQDLPGNILVTPTPETLCAPNSNGSALATLQSGQNENQFNFTWFENNDGTGPVFSNPGVTGAGTNGELLNQSKVAVADWTIGAAGFGSGDRTFYVQAVKNANAPSGFGCATPIRQVIIPDAHISPQIALVPTVNSFCGAINPGDLGDGSIAITVDANPSAPGVQTSTLGFNYTWTTPNAALTSPQNGAANTLTIPQLGNGSYTVNAVNVDNGCITTSSTTINPAPFTLTLSATAIDQQICNPDGQINVTQITIDRSAVGLGNITQNSSLPLTSVYDFQWFAADPTNPNVIVNTPLQDGVGPTNINAQSLITGNGAGQFPTMGAGTYYVVATRRAGSGVATGCSTFPVRVDVDDVHKNPLIALRPFSNTSCLAGPGTGEGIIEIRVTDPTPLTYNGGAAFSYSYDWSAASGITDSPANDGDGSSADGDGDRITNLLEGNNYGLTVTNPSSGCFSTATTTIIKNATPIFVQNVTAVDQINCFPVGDGSLNVVRVTLNNRQGTVETFDATGTASPISNFNFTWTRPTIGQQTTAGTLLDVVSYNAANFGGAPIGAGTYTVVATRVTTPNPNDVGRGCSSAPFTINIIDKRISPVVSLTPFANTACDPLFSEGSIEVRVADNTLVPGPHTFTYNWDVTAPANPTAIATTVNNNGDGLPGDGDVPQALFHGDYDVRVTNNQSGCSSIGSTTIFRNSTPIIIPEAVTTPQVICSADGSVRVTSVEVTDRNNNTFTAPFADFDFTWTAVPGGASVITDGALGAVPGGTIIDRTVFPSIERGQYIVTATRVAGTLGRGCVSAPYHATIEDLRVFPELRFTQRPNSSCTPINPNGQLVANAREVSGVNTGPYTFSWTLNGGAVSPASVQSNTANSSTLNNALHGNYLVTATNNATNCPVTSPVTLVLDQSLSTPNIIEVTTVDPLDCNPTGQASVTRITLGSTTNSILFPPNVPPNNEISGAALTNFDYEWYQGSVAASNQLPAGGPPFTTTPTITSLLTGTYFVVVRDPATDCRSGARQVVINPDDIVLPDLNVSQTALQISCRPGIGSAELSVTADGQTDTDPNYTFTWFANATATGTPIGTASTLSNIPAGTYSVTVHNNTTNCSISDSYIIEDDTQDFTPVISMASQPRTLCVGTDGAIYARVLNLSPLYPYPYTATTFTADLYVGSNPNLNNAADFPAIPNAVGFVGNFSQNNLNEGFYTVRITDNNTGCFSVATEEIKDARLFPAVKIDELAPVTNCDPARPNGVAQVSANNSFAGFTFDWYEGATATGTPVYSGAEFSEMKVKPQQYTVRATNTTTGCFTDVVTDIENGTVPIPAATIEVISHVTSCVTDNGALMAYVGADKNTANYIFHWYDGTVENPPADNVGETYKDLAVGMYSVTATSVITGCKSPLTTAEILNEQVLPNFDFVIENSTCDQQDGFASLVLLNDVAIERIEWYEIAPEPSGTPFLTGPNFTDAGAGIYEITATTFLGCATTKQIEIKPDIRPYNGISRNNDGRNDIFQIDCIQNFPTNIVRIFNRAGTLVYEAENYDNSSTFFDGKSNRGISPMGVNLPDGTYYYIVDKRDGTKPVAGYLEIVK
jgi:gliding motility-associated-like protein